MPEIESGLFRHGGCNCCRSSVAIVLMIIVSCHWVLVLSLIKSRVESQLMFAAGGSRKARQWQTANQSKGKSPAKARVPKSTATPASSSNIQQPPCTHPIVDTAPIDAALRHVPPYSPLYCGQPPGGAPDPPRRPRAPRRPAAKAHPRRRLYLARRVQLALHPRYQRQEGHHRHSQLQEVPLRQ